MVRSFSLIEILFVIGILIILVSAMVFISGNLLQRQVTLDGVTQDIISTLREAQSNSVGSKNLSSYGVHFVANTYVLFAGSTYNPSAPDNEVKQIPPEIELISINLAGSGTDVVFQRIDGSTQHSGTLIIAVKADPTKSRTLVIEPSGNVSVSQGISPTNTRVTDTRHVHFNLGWSIQGASTFTLTFSDPPNPDSVQTIALLPYFNAGQTVFDWQGTLGVGGENQTLRIHTHSLTSSDTTLCVHRDRRFNTKALVIRIDSNDIVSYASDGQATVQPFGGTMQVQ